MGFLMFKRSQLSPAVQSSQEAAHVVLLIDFIWESLKNKQKKELELSSQNLFGDLLLLMQIMSHYFQNANFIQVFCVGMHLLSYI